MFKMLCSLSVLWFIFTSLVLLRWPQEAARLDNHVSSSLLPGPRCYVPYDIYLAVTIFLSSLWTKLKNNLSLMKMAFYHRIV